MTRSKTNNRWTLVDQSFLSLFITFSLIELTNIGSGIIDGLVVSNFYDADSLAAVGIASPMFSISGIISGLFATGMQTMCAQELGKGNIKALNRIYSAVFYVCIAVSLVFMTAELVFAPQLAALFGASGKGAELAELSTKYIRGLAIGFPAIVLSVVVSSGCQLDSGRKRVMRATIIYSVVNIIFDLLVVVLKFGVFGIGLATSLAMYVQLGYLLLHFKTKDRMLYLTKLDSSFKEMLEIMSLGTEKALRRIGNVIAPIVVNKMMIHYGGLLAMSAMAVHNNVNNFVSFMAVGLADATALQAGIFYGEKNDEAIRETGNCVHRNAGIFLGAMSILTLILSRPIAAVYISDRGELFNMSVFGVCMTGLIAVPNAFVRSRISYLQSVHKTKNMQAMSVLFSLGSIVLSALILGKLFGAYGMLGTNLLAAVLTLITVWLFYAIKCKKPLPSPKDYLALPDSFDLSPGDVISLDIRDTEDIALVAEQIQLFCRGHKIDGKTGMKAALCFEELAVNIINFGFPKCKGQPGLDLRLVFAKDEMVMRLRDNCPMFDVERYIAQEIDGTAGSAELRLGLKMISGLAENISYVHSLENNNVIIRFPNQ
ncbi:MAG: ATP-binding protein [Ruminococcus sp.]|nr:ATP-binding protein [Ruminococcus sp.]